MRYHFFLHYGWFFQNVGKEAVRTFMHTTVPISRSYQLPAHKYRVCCIFVPAFTTIIIRMCESTADSWFFAYFIVYVVLKS